MNPLSKKLTTGTVGELLVQLRLFQFDVQAAPPLKDSGNDLIAVRNEVFRSIQVKTTRQGNGTWSIPKNRKYNLLALVRVAGEDDRLALDDSEIFLIDRNKIDSGEFQLKNISDYRMSEELVNDLFQD